MDTRFFHRTQFFLTSFEPLLWAGLIAFFHISFRRCASDKLFLFIYSSSCYLFILCVQTQNYNRFNVTQNIVQLNPSCCCCFFCFFYSFVPFHAAVGRSSSFRHATWLLLINKCNSMHCERVCAAWHGQFLPYINFNYYLCIIISEAAFEDVSTNLLNRLFALPFIWHLDGTAARLKCDAGYCSLFSAFFLSISSRKRKKWKLIQLTEEQLFFQRISFQSQTDWKFLFDWIFSQRFFTFWFILSIDFHFCSFF